MKKTKEFWRKLRKPVPKPTQKFRDNSKYLRRNKHKVVLGAE